MLICSDKAPRFWIKMPLFITKLTPVYNRRPGMTYEPVILACGQKTSRRVGLAGVGDQTGPGWYVWPCASLSLGVRLKWAHRGVLWSFTTEMNSLGQLNWGCVKCTHTLFPQVCWSSFIASVLIKPISVLHHLFGSPKCNRGCICVSLWVVSNQLHLDWAKLIWHFPLVAKCYHIFFYPSYPSRLFVITAKLTAANQLWA